MARSCSIVCAISYGLPAKRVGEESPDAVFIGGLAVFAHAVGSRWQEGRHDVDCYLSLIGKTAMRDRYDIRYAPHLHKD